MKLHIYAFGKPALPFMRDGIAEYEKRLKRYGGVKTTYLKQSQNPTKQLLEASEGTLRIVLDERGQDWTTKEFTDFINSAELDGATKKVSFLIGPADGHTKEMRQVSNKLIRLSALTLQHEHALLILLEQLYRVRTIQAGTPYHR